MKKEYECHTMEEWDEIDKKDRKKHPIKFFFKDIFNFVYYGTKRFLSNIKWGILHRTFYRYHIVDTKLAPGWWDSDSKILHASFSILEDFMEKEKPGDIIDWTSDDKHKHAWAEITSLYIWWKDRKHRKDPYKDVEPKTDKWMEDKEYIDAIRASAELDNKWYQEDTDNLVRLAKIRSFLWT